MFDEAFSNLQNKKAKVSTGSLGLVVVTNFFSHFRRLDYVCWAAWNPAPPTVPTLIETERKAS